MSARRLRLRELDIGELRVAAVASCATALVALLAVYKDGMAGLLVPLALATVLILLYRPLALAVVVVGLTILCEGPTFGFLHFTSKLYIQIYKGLTPLDILVVLVVLAVGIDAIRRRRPVRVPRALIPGVVMLLLAMLVGIITGHAAGVSLRTVVLSENVLVYVLLLPVVLANLNVDRRQVTILLGGAVALAILKATLGLVEVLGHYGEKFEGTSTLTYYEPTANWLIMIALLWAFATILARARPPRWVLLASPLLIASLALSYRRSFWIAAVLGLLLVLLLGTSPIGRRMLLPTGLMLALAIVLLGSIHLQNQIPAVKRVESLAPSKLTTNVEDRYRLDERANVLGEIRRDPITGLGMSVPWQAIVQPLSAEHENGREYVHFAALWFWLKLGVLGLVAYFAILAGAAVLAWRAWRRSAERLLRAFGLASLCGLAGLVVIETTATFTGVDPRFTVLLCAQIGLLALLDGVPPARAGVTA